MPTFVLVLIAPPGHAAALDALACATAQSANGAAWSAPVWLSEGEAAEIAFTVGDATTAAAIRNEVAQAALPHPIDVAVVPADGRRKRLLIADMDSTIIQQECIDEMADVLGLKAPISAITERAMRGELDFEAALKERLGLLAGISEAELEGVYRQRVTLMPGARSLVATMRANGAYTALVSGGFTFFTSRVAADVGFDENRANTLALEQRKLTGHVVGPILGREAKLAALQELTQTKGLAPAQTLAVGDGANDLAMISRAGLGVAYRAKPVVAAEAHAAITHGDLTALLYLQGYRRQEIIKL
ncbi:MAG: phosphoserine phosphatase SerB [Hyphomicrobiaceae bacterium]